MHLNALLLRKGIGICVKMRGCKVMVNALKCVTAGEGVNNASILSKSLRKELIVNIHDQLLN